MPTQEKADKIIKLIREQQFPVTASELLKYLTSISHNIDFEISESIKENPKDTILTIATFTERMLLELNGSESTLGQMYVMGYNDKPFFKKTVDDWLTERYDGLVKLVYKNDLIMLDWTITYE